MGAIISGHHSTCSQLPEDVPTLCNMRLPPQCTILLEQLAEREFKHHRIVEKNWFPFCPTLDWNFLVGPFSVSQQNVAVHSNFKGANFQFHALK